MRIGENGVVRWVQPQERPGGHAVLVEGDVLGRPAERVGITRFGVTEATFTGRHDDPEVGETLLVSAPGLREGASGGALLNAVGAVVGIIRGAVDDDPTGRHVTLDELDDLVRLRLRDAATALLPPRLWIVLELQGEHGDKPPAEAR